MFSFKTFLTGDFTYIELYIPLLSAVVGIFFVYGVLIKILADTRKSPISKVFLWSFGEAISVVLLYFSCSAIIMFLIAIFLFFATYLEAFSISDQLLINAGLILGAPLALALYYYLLDEYLSSFKSRFDREAYPMLEQFHLPIIMVGYLLGIIISAVFLFPLTITIKFIFLSVFVILLSSLFTAIDMPIFFILILSGLFLIVNLISYAYMGAPPLDLIYNKIFYQSFLFEGKFSEKTGIFFELTFAIITLLSSVLKKVWSMEYNRLITPRKLERPSFHPVYQISKADNHNLSEPKVVEIKINKINGIPHKASQDGIIQLETSEESTKRGSPHPMARRPYDYEIRDLKCPFCKVGFKETDWVIECPSCHAPYHIYSEEDNCWAAAKSCMAKPFCPGKSMPLRPVAYTRLQNNAEKKASKPPPKEEILNFMDVLNEEAVSNVKEKLKNDDIKKALLLKSKLENLGPQNMDEDELLFLLKIIDIIEKKN